MRRQTLTAAIAAIALVTSLGTATLAKGGGQGGHGGQAKPVTFRVTAKPAEQGGKMRVKVKAIHGDRTVTVTSTAVVTLDGGDTDVTLAQRGHRSRNYMGRADVPLAESLGCKTVVVTVTYGTDTPQVFTRAAAVVAPGTDMETVEACPLP